MKQKFLLALSLLPAMDSMAAAVPASTTTTYTTTYSTPSQCYFRSGTWVELGLGWTPEVTVRQPGTVTDQQMAQKIQNNQLLINWINPLGSKAKSSFLGAINFGANYRPDNSWLLVGIYLGGALSNSQSKIRYTITPRIANAKEQELTLAARDKGYFTAAVRFGVPIRNVMPFLKLGWAMHRSALKPELAQAASLNTWNNAVVLGGGFDFDFSYLVLGISAETHLSGSRAYASERFSIPSPYVNLGNPRFKTRSTIVMLTLKYQFPSGSVYGFK